MKFLYSLICFFIFFWIGSLQSQEYSYPTGGKITKASAYNKIPYFSSSSIRSELPSRKSIASYAPHAGRQEYQDCSAWAVAHALTMSWAIKKQERNTQTITDSLFSPSFLYTQARLPNRSCSEGVRIDEVVHVASTLGCPRQADFENGLMKRATELAQQNGNTYACYNQIPDEAIHQALGFKIRGIERLTPHSGSTNITQIKQALIQETPVILAIDTYLSFASDQSLGKAVWNGNKDLVKGHHALVVIAYDDQKYGGAVQVLNSWGTQWGQSGLMWIKYADVKQILIEAFRIRLQDEWDFLPATMVHAQSELDFRIDKKIKPTFLAFHEGFRLEESLTNGTYLEINLKSETPLYSKALRINSTSGVDLISSTSTSDRPQKHISIPGKGKALNVFGKPGKEFLIFFLSKQMIDIQSIKQRFQATDSTQHLKDRIRRSTSRNLRFIEFNSHVDQRKLIFNAKYDAEVIYVIVVGYKLK